MFRFSSELVSNNEAYDSYLKTNFDREKIETTRVMFLIATGLYILFFIVDAISVVHNYSEIMIVRIFAIVNILAVVWLLSYRQSLFLKFYQVFMCYTFKILGFSIILMIYLSAETDIAYQTYFAGLTLVVIAIFPFTYINTKVLLCLALSIVTEHFLVFFFLRGDQSESHFALAMNNSFFLIGGIGVGIMMELMKKKLLYVLFRTEHTLKKHLMTNVRDELIYHAKDEHEVATYLERLKQDAEFSHTQVYVKKISIDYLKQSDFLKNTVDLSMPYKFYTVVLRNNVIFYAYFYEVIDTDVVRKMDGQINRMLKDQNFDMNSCLTITDFKLSDIKKLLMSGEPKVESKKSSVSSIAGEK